MPKLTTKNAALAALLTAGLAGSAAVMLVPPVAVAQSTTDNNSNSPYRDNTSTHRVVYHRYHASAYHRDWLGIGTPGSGFGFYTNPYHHYCSRWDARYGYCTWF